VAFDVRPHDLAGVVDAIGRSSGRAGHVEAEVAAVLEDNTMLPGVRIKVDACDLSGGVVPFRRSILLSKGLAFFSSAASMIC
jgi:hypothetical protein